MPNQYLDSADTNEEFRRRLDLIEAILGNKFPQISTKEILEMLDLKIADIKKTRFYQEIIQTGLQEGQQLDLQQGKIKGKRKQLSPCDPSVNPSL